MLAHAADTAALFRAVQCLAPERTEQFAHPPISPLNFTSSPLALNSTTFHSRLNSGLFKLYHILIPLLRNHTATIVADYYRSTMHPASSARLPWIFTWHRNEQSSLAIADLI